MMLWILAAMAYVQVGFQLGKKSSKTWKNGDSKSLASFLLFPMSHARGTVGQGSLPFMSGIHDDDTFFRVLVTLLWPLMFLWNGTLVAGILGPDKVITRLLKQPPTLEERFAELELEEKKVDRALKRLEAPKRPRASRKKKAQAQALSPANAPPAVAEPSPVTPLEAATPARSESVPPPVQVRVTVDVTAPGHATDSDADVEPESVREAEQPRAAEHDRIVH